MRLINVFFSLCFVAIGYAANPWDAVGVIRPAASGQSRPPIGGSGAAPFFPGSRPEPAQPAPPPPPPSNGGLPHPRTPFRTRYKGACEDVYLECEQWFERGLCTNLLIRRRCPNACDNCPTWQLRSCKDTHRWCSAWSDNLQCSKNPKYMKYNCPRSCHTCL